MNKVTGLLFVVVTLAAGRASAQQGLVGPFSNRGKVVLSAERFFGYAHSTRTQSMNGFEATQESDNISVVGNPLGALDANYAWPRLAVDGVLPVGVTIGGTASAYSSSVKPPGAADSTTVVKGFSLGARVGFGYMFAPFTGIWPRAGFVYVDASNDNTATSLYALTLDAPLVFALSTHAALTVAPTLDLGLGGSTKNKQTNISIDTKGTDAGLQIGIVVIL